MRRVRLTTAYGQSLVEFAFSLPAVLTLIVLSVRMLMILNTWYVLINAADIGVRAAALTGRADSGRRLVLENMPGVSSDEISVIFTQPFAKVPAVPCANSAAIASTITPDNRQTFAFPPTPTIMPHATADPLGLADPHTILDAPIRIQVVYRFQIIGPLAPDWIINLTACATARLEARLVPLPPLTYF